MLRRNYFVSLAILIAAAVVPAAPAQEQQMAQLGECPLESGQRLLDCQLGYRTFGQLAPDKGNVIISPTAPDDYVFFSQTLKEVAAQLVNLPL